MSSEAMPPDVTASPPTKRRVTKSEALIDHRIRQTRRQVRLNDLTAAALVLACGTILYLLLAALVDHWLVPGGLGFWGRLVAFVGLFTAMGAYFWYAVLPLVLHRINPIFAAQSLEQVRPSLKNGLVNLLFLSREQGLVDRDTLSKKVLRGLERTTAAELAEVPVELAVDRSHVVKLGYLLVGVLAVACLYLVLSPKNPLVSAGRVLFPWADVDQPTRVSIDRIEPGNVRAFQGDTLTVSAEILGLKESEQPTLVFSTADGQSIHQAIPLTEGDAFRFHAELPPGSNGLQQDVTYSLKAGDARSSEFIVRVEPALSITVEAVDYEYPDYTGIADRTDTKTADLRAIEGTRVTLHATTSQPITQSAIELNCDPRQRLTMMIEGTHATAQFALTMREDEPSEPRYESYQLRATDSEGRLNRRPSRHEIEVIRDRPPEIHLIDPPPEKIELPENGLLELKILAEDPDFGLRCVALIVERDEPAGGKLRTRPLLERIAPEPAHEASFDGTYRFVPSQLGLQADDRVIYWAEATDNRPTPNLSETERRWITITAPAPGEQTPKPEEAQQEGTPEENQQDKGEEGKDAGEEGKDAGEEGKDAGEEGKDAGEEGKDAGEEGKDAGEEGKDAGEEGKDAGEEGKDAGEEGKQAGEEGKQAGEEGKDAGEEGKQAGEDGKQAGEDGKQAGEDGKDAGEDGKQAGEEGKQAGEDGKQAGEGEESTGNMPSPSGTEASDSGESDGQPISGDTAPGDAIREILEHKGQSGESPQDGSQENSTSDANSDTKSSPEESSPDGETSTDAETNPGQDPSGKGEQQSPQKSDPTETGDPQPQSGDLSDKKDPKELGPSSETPSDTPEPQGANQERAEGTDPKPSEVGSEQEAESPSISPKESTAEGESSGSQSGEGEEGGGQESPQPGTDTPGSSTPADQGANRANEKGEGKTGPNAGDQVQADQPTGSEGPREPGKQDGQNEKSGKSDAPGQSKKPSNNADSPTSESGNQPPAQPNDKNQGGDIPTGKAGKGSVGSQNQNELRDGDLKPQETPGEDAVNREFAKKQTELALEHLEEQMALDEPELLDRLGWTEAEAEKFLNQWNDMFRAAGRSDAEGRKAQHELDRALNSLGLRPSGAEIEGGSFQKDTQKKLEGRRFAPPAEWAEQFRAYNRAVAGQKSDR